MANHILKTRPEYWHAVRKGDKTFEVRRNDRGFLLGDELTLRLIGQKPDDTWEEHTGPNGEFFDLHRRVSYVLEGGRWGIEPGFVVLGLK